MTNKKPAPSYYHLKDGSVIQAATKPKGARPATDREIAIAGHMSRPAPNPPVATKTQPTQKD